MGIEIDKSSFSDEDQQRFSHRLEENLAALQRLLEQPDFGRGPGSLGAELEMYIVDARGNPRHVNQEILAAAADPQLTLELNRYNLEYNLSPFAMNAEPFLSTEQEILRKLEFLGEVAAGHGGRIVPIGILPTLRTRDFGHDCITQRQRYYALVSQLIKRRGSKFRIEIDGKDPLQLEMEDITLEGANTSFQVHYRVQPQDYADTYNAIQLVSPLALAVAANSPTLFGHSLWHETRIPLFKQSIDTRIRDRYHWNEPARVNYGQGWVRRGAAELFTEVVRIYPPLLPLCSDASPAEELAGGRAVPSLAELRLHQSTVWLWNRPIFDDLDGGHLRVEMRALPAGPTALDMVANAAFMIGLAEGLRPRIEELIAALPFKIADYNFYRGAQHGLDAELVWPYPAQSGYRARPVADIIADLLPVAADGLAAVGIGADEASRYLDVIEGRLRRRQNGAIWQQRTLAALGESRSREEALHALLERFIDNSRANRPVAEWEV
jgi:gamma-glutamyl:cysteine ligase YbdK (ATP-grasp superfamily)